VSNGGFKARVYVAGPYTQGDSVHNVREALRTADILLNFDYCPFVPHLTHFWHLVFPRPYDTWMRLDKEWLRQCDVLLRLSGNSPGADEEEMLAHSLYIPVVHSIAELEKLYAAAEDRDTGKSQEG